MGAQRSAAPKEACQKTEIDISRVDALRLALSHPARAQALSIFAERVACPREIADEIGVELSDLSYHVRVLRDLHLIEAIKEKKIRGTVAHFYRAIIRPVVDDDEWAAMDINPRIAFSNCVFTVLAADFASSVASRDFEARDDSHLTRIPVLVDELGWERITGILRRALFEVMDAQEESAQRLLESGEEGFRVIAALMCFEAARRGDALKEEAFFAPGPPDLLDEADAPDAVDEIKVIRTTSPVS